MSNAFAPEATVLHAPDPSPDEIEAREALVKAAIRVLTTTTFHEVSYDRVIAESGVRPDTARSQFPSWGHLVLATLQVWNAQRMAPIMPIAGQSGAVAFLRAIVLANLQDPSLMRFIAAMASISATPGHPMAPQLQAQWIQFHAAVQRALMNDIAIGREPATVDPARGAEQMIAMYEGLQLQCMARGHMDLVESFDRAMAVLRDAWSRIDDQQVWDI